MANDNLILFSSEVEKESRFRPTTSDSSNILVKEWERLEQYLSWKTFFPTRVCFRLQTLSAGKAKKNPGVPPELGESFFSSA